MGQPTSTFSTYDAVGNRESLSSAIHMLNTAETPFLSALEKVEGTSTKHEWQTEALASASASNFVIEGDDATTDASTATARRYNYMGISDKVAVVSGTQEVVKKAGRSSEMAKQMSKRAKELKKDQEAILLANQAAAIGTDTTARNIAGAQAWIKTNINKAADATACTGDGTDIHTDGTARALEESFIEAALADAWDNGGNPTMGICGKFQKRKIAAFSGSSTKTQDGAAKKVVNTVDMYVDPLGNEIKFVPCRQAPTDVVYMFDMEMVKMAVLRDYTTADLAKTGDSIRKQLLTEYTLEMCNEAAHCVVSDLTTS
jgi:hypothetical protein